VNQLIGIVSSISVYLREFKFLLGNAATLRARLPKVLAAAEETQWGWQCV
jgi:hypothetical protein